mmetsp:Transcript_20636/g.43142  ORF Transcript_20636/g.43142 Transcript_20636/m.43142 type:complete len:142 (+) Transcript_20636:170-595(+)
MYFCSSSPPPPPPPLSSAVVVRSAVPFPDGDHSTTSFPFFDRIDAVANAIAPAPAIPTLGEGILSLSEPPLALPSAVALQAVGESLHPRPTRRFGLEALPKNRTSRNANEALAAAENHAAITAAMIRFIAESNQSINQSID